MATFNGQIAASADDAREIGAGTVSLTNSYLSFAAATNQIGLRFQGVTIPRRSAISSATLGVYVNSTATDDPDLAIYGEAGDDAAAFTTANFDISGRSKTGAFVAWSAASLGVGVATSPDISAVIQEIVDRPGWAAGNALALILTGQPSYVFEIAAWDGSDPAAELDIVYIEPAGARPRVQRARLTARTGGLLT